jgi:YggT family protein
MRHVGAGHRQGRGLAVFVQLPDQAQEGIHEGAPCSRALAPAGRAVNRDRASGLRFHAGSLRAWARETKGPSKGPTPMQSLYQILMLLLDIVWFFIIAHVIMSWLINFQVLNLRQQFVAQIWYALNRLLEPIYAPIRNILPNMSGIDLAPLVALVGVYALRIILINNAAVFY